MPELLLATTNPGKVREYRSLFSGLDYRITTLTEQGISKVIAETGSSYEQNAKAKAIAYAKLSQLITISDDSGLEVDALSGEPGVHSARFAGENATDEDKVKSLLSKINDIPWEKRTACFKCVIAIATPGGQLELCHGECRGMISFEHSGVSGFGYDPIFYLPSIKKTMAELSFKEKNKISHRAQASRIAIQLLKQLHKKTY